MGFFTSSMAGNYSWNSNSKIIGNGEVYVYSIHGDGEYLVMSNDIFGKEPSKTFIDNEHILNGLLLNKKWPKEVIIDSDQDLINEILKFNIPANPQEKLDYLFEYLFNEQREDGVAFKIYLSFNDNLSQSLFFKNNNEFKFYINTLNEKNLINIKSKLGSDVRSLGGSHTPDGFELSITFDGFAYYEKITNEGLKSTNCFIAMNFDDSMSETRMAIKSACKKTGFNPILIDEIHYASDSTINDAIIAELKKSKFCIADFTGQKDGVYFESGFALGRGLKVIYSVLKSDLKNSHFDTKHFPHITYDTNKELEEKLINKIEAWIKD